MGLFHSVFRFGAETEALTFSQSISVISASKPACIGIRAACLAGCFNLWGPRSPLWHFSQQPLPILYLTPPQNVISREMAGIPASSGESSIWMFRTGNQDESVGFGEGNGNKLGLGLLSCGKNSWENSWVNLSLLVFIRTSCHWFIFSPWDWEKYMGAWQVGNGNSSSAITLCHPQRDVQQESLKWALLHMDREAPQTFLWLRNLFTKAISGQSHYLFLF